MTKEERTEKKRNALKTESVELFYSALSESDRKNEVVSLLYHLIDHVPNEELDTYLSDFFYYKDGDI